jgi:hypothetical protein
MLVIDGKYKQWRWQDKEDKIPWGFGRESSGETTLRKTRAARLKLSEFAEEKEDRDPQPLDLIQKSRQPSDRTRAARDLPSGNAKVKSQQNVDRQI